MDGTGSIIGRGNNAYKNQQRKGWKAVEIDTGIFLGNGV